MHAHTRRAFLRTSALAAAGALAACATTTTNGVTTVTVNTASIDAWAQAFQNGAGLIAGLPGIAGTPVAAAAVAIVAVVKADLDAFNAAAAGKVTLTFDATSVPAAVNSILKDGQTLLADAKGALGNVAASALQTAQTYVSAVQTIVSLLEAAIGGPVPLALAAAATPMTEEKALAVLKVQ